MKILLGQAQSATGRKLQVVPLEESRAAFRVHGVDSGHPLSVLSAEVRRDLTAGASLPRERIVPVSDTSTTTDA